MTKMFAPKIPEPTAKAPTLRKVEAPVKELGDQTRNDKTSRDKKGRASLRITPSLGGLGSGKTGINVP